MTALIILNYNNYEDTINCIESVEKFNTAPIKLVVVDNASTRKGIREKLGNFLNNKYGEDCQEYGDADVANLAGGVTLSYCSYIKSDVNDGYARGNNKGLRLVEKDFSIEYVMILNNDVLFVEDIIPQLVREYESNDNTGVLSPLLYKKNFKGIDYNCARKCESVATTIGRFLLYYHNPFGIKSKWNRQQQYLLMRPELKDAYKFEIQLPSGSCMLINRDLFRNIGYFDPNTFLYNEENILYQKLKRFGKISYILPELKCIHLGASSTKNEKGYFMIKVSADSTCYYLSQYTDAPGFVKILFRFYIQNIFLPLVKIQKKIK